MDTLREYQMTNNHLDHQMIRLKQCKEELLDLFDNLDRLETSLPSNDSICTYEVHHHIHRPPYNSDLLNSSSSSSSSSDESEQHYKAGDKYGHVQPRPISKPIMRFSYKIPVNYETNSALSLSQSVDFKSLMSLAEQINSKRANRAKNLEDSEDFNENPRRQRRPPIAPPNPFKSQQSPHIKRPNSHIHQSSHEWNGTRPQTSSSFNSSSFRNSSYQMGNRSRSMSTDGASKKSNTKLNNPWKHVGKTKPDSALFLSSQDFSRSSQDIKIQRSIDFGSEETKPRAARQPLRRPMTRSLSNLSDYKPPQALNRKSLIQRQKEIEKPMRKQLIDEKDVGKGWKPTTKANVKEIGFKIYAPPPQHAAPSTSQDLTKDGQRSLRKSLLDEKDVGKGWKPAGKKDTFNDVYKSANVEKLPIESANVTPVDKKTKFNDSKDVGKGWKPTGIASKPPKPTTASKSTEQDPLMRTTRFKPSSVKKLKKNSSESKSSLNNENKQPIEDLSINRMATSTPDFNQKAGDGFKDDLDESIIEKEVSDASVAKRKSSSPTLNRSPNESKNKKNENLEALNENINSDEKKESEVKGQTTEPDAKGNSNWDDDEDIEDTEADMQTNKQSSTDVPKNDEEKEPTDLKKEGENKNLNDIASDEDTEPPIDDKTEKNVEDTKKDDETPATTNREPTEEELDEQEKQFWNIKDDDDDDE